MTPPELAAEIKATAAEIDRIDLVLQTTINIGRANADPQDGIRVMAYFQDLREAAAASLARLAAGGMPSGLAAGQEWERFRMHLARVELNAAAAIIAPGKFDMGPLAAAVGGIRSSPLDALAPE